MVIRSIGADDNFEKCAVNIDTPIDVLSDQLVQFAQFHQRIREQLSVVEMLSKHQAKFGIDPNWDLVARGILQFFDREAYAHQQD